jgi:hypothetical protein
LDLHWNGGRRYGNSSNKASKRYTKNEGSIKIPFVLERSSNSLFPFFCLNDTRIHLLVLVAMTLIQTAATRACRIYASPLLAHHQSVMASSRVVNGVLALVPRNTRGYLAKSAMLAHQRALTTESSSVASRSVIRNVNISKEERAALRAARKQRATMVLQQHQQQQAAQTVDNSASSSIAVSQSAPSSSRISYSRYIWYGMVGIPTSLLIWAFNDENSPPAQLSQAVGLTNLISYLTDSIAKPSHEKLLPDWSQVSILPLLKVGLDPFDSEFLECPCPSVALSK